ncbi:polysaccharide biosynthesis/export family protein [Methylocapsa acidiphila]|uniref:polysaccharide biosynthesis/export family protein n=1 Tax=Methylocapsa acidiphila TaxID=133552 RepID=UPI0003FA9918|nr:polysaccharide biosynthesis/export family protein [Methylocapsa acidiphila]
MLSFRSAWAFVFSAALLNVGGCSYFPVNGPVTPDIQSGSSALLPYALIRLTPEAVDILAAYEPKGLAGAFTDRKPASNIKFGIGDIISVTIFEAAAGGLFIPLEAGVRPGNYVALPDQPIDNNGNITIPFAGTIRAAGRDNVQVQNEIVEKIKNRAIEPQAVVTLSQQRTSLISVVGEVNTPLRFAVPATGAGDRILDALTRAGGIRGQGYETWVMLERDNRRATVPFENLVMNPSNNIYIQPGDRIYVYREQQKFIAFGATGSVDVLGSQAEFTFDAWRINLAEAVAKAGGLQDARADAGAVFLYRREPREVAALLGADVARFREDLVPVIFWVNFRDPAGYFLATRMQMRNQDIIYAANAGSIESQKVLEYANLVASTAGLTASSVTESATARAALQGKTLVTPTASSTSTTISQGITTVTTVRP